MANLIWPENCKKHQNSQKNHGINRSENRQNDQNDTIDMSKSDWIFVSATHCVVEEMWLEGPQGIT